MVSYKLSLRKPEKSDIPYLVKWAAAPSGRIFYHYLPKTLTEGNSWVQRSMLDKTRDDFMIYATEEDGEKYPIGMLGLSAIDDVNRKAEYYILIGDDEFLRRGIAYRTSKEMIQATYFRNYELNKLCARVDKDNFPAMKLFEKLGFRKEGVLVADRILPDGKKVDTVYYGLLSADTL